MKKLIIGLFSFLSITISYSQEPNILLIIADDLGVDYMNSYHNSKNIPFTPTIDSLRRNGLKFSNVYATPKCTPTRGAIMSGKHGIKTGVQGSPSNLSTSHISLFNAIENETNGAYSDAVIGKWHISHPANSNHPFEHGADYYTGLLKAEVSNYKAWEHTHNGQEFIDTNYATTVLTDSSIKWIDKQKQPFFLWLAHVAPHGPFHEPPSHLYSITNTDNNSRKYVAMIEAMDHEIGRLLNTMSNKKRKNTIIIFLGDNGTPGAVSQNYPSERAKSTIYEGGIHVPMIISGPGITRIGETEDAMINVIDLYATILELTGATLNGGIYNSLSFKHLLDNTASVNPTRDYNYSEFNQGPSNFFTIRNKEYKLIQNVATGNQELYKVDTDTFELNELIQYDLDNNLKIIKADLEQEANNIRSSWSCRDHIKNGDEEEIDCGGSTCAPCLSSINKFTNSELVTLGPNPVVNVLNINSNRQTTVEIINFYGSPLLIKSFNGNTTINLSTLPSGSYYIKIKTKEFLEYKTFTKE